MNDLVDAISFEGDYEPQPCMLPTDSILYNDESPVDNDTEFCFLCSFSCNTNYNSCIKHMESMLCGKIARKTRPRDRINNVFIYYETKIRPFVRDPNNMIGCGDSPAWSKECIKRHSDFHDKSHKNILFKHWSVITESSNLLRFNQLCVKTPDGICRVDDKGLKSYELLLKLLLQLGNKLDVSEEDFVGNKRKRT